MKIPGNGIPAMPDGPGLRMGNVIFLGVLLD
jgi:hypothetical protein